MMSLQYALPLFLINLALLVFAMGYRQKTPTPTKAKVFVIGLSKTGTTSLGDALEHHLNYTRYGWHDIWSRYLVHQAILAKPNHDPLIAVTEEFEVLEDLPWCLPEVYRSMSRLYPDSKFVLSLRRSDEVWLESMRRHAQQKLWEGHKQIYGAYHVDGNEGVFLNTYRNHTAEVRRFFATEEMKGRGLEVIIDDPKESDEEKWAQIVNLLGVKIDAGALGGFPKSNGNQVWMNKDPLGIVWLEYRFGFVLQRGLVNFMDFLGYMTALRPDVLNGRWSAM